MLSVQEQAAQDIARGVISELGSRKGFAAWWAEIETEDRKDIKTAITDVAYDRICAMTGGCL